MNGFQVEQQRLQLVADLQARSDDLQAQTTALEEARQEAERASRAKSEFLANMSHELRTPMNSIMGFTQRLITKLSDTLPEREMKALLTVDRNAKHLLVLINDILDLAKIEAGKMDLNRSRLNLAAVVREAVEQAAPLTDNKPIEVRLDLPARTPDVRRRPGQAQASRAEPPVQRHQVHQHGDRDDHGRREEDDDRAGSSGPPRGPGHGRRDQAGGPGPALPAVHPAGRQLIPEGRRHGPRAGDQRALRADARRPDRRGQRVRPGDRVHRPATAPGDGSTGRRPGRSEWPVPDRMARAAKAAEPPPPRHRGPAGVDAESSTGSGSFASTTSPTFSPSCN